MTRAIDTFPVTVSVDASRSDCSLTRLSNPRMVLQSSVRLVPDNRALPRCSTPSVVGGAHSSGANSSFHSSRLF